MNEATDFHFAWAQAADFESLHTLRLAAMRPSLEALGRYDPVRSRERFVASFSPLRTRRIVAAGATIGFAALRHDDNV